jgi:hypothetical protein
MARAPVSKTGGWGFESLHSCQVGLVIDIANFFARGGTLFHFMSLTILPNLLNSFRCARTNRIRTS